MDEHGKAVELMPDAEAFSDEKGWALRRAGTVRRAGDDGQSSIIEALSKRRCSIDALVEAVGGTCGAKMRDDEASLAVARFILDFGEFLKG